MDHGAPAEHPAGRVWGWQVKCLLGADSKQVRIFTYFQDLSPHMYWALPLLIYDLKLLKR